MKVGEIWITTKATPPYKVRIIELIQDEDAEWVAYVVLEEDTEKFKAVILEFAGMTEDFLNMMLRHGTVLSRQHFLDIFRKHYGDNQ